MVEVTARPVSCSSDQVCSRLGGEAFRCQADLCQAETQSLLPEDRIALCLAGTGSTAAQLSKLTALQKKRITLARSCRAPCEVPRNCRQP